MRAPLLYCRTEQDLGQAVGRSFWARSEQYDGSAVLMQTLLDMFGLFKKKDPRAVLEERYKELLAESFRLSTVDRKASDLKRAEAEELYEEINTLPQKGNATS